MCHQFAHVMPCPSEKLHLRCPLLQDGWDALIAEGEVRWPTADILVVRQNEHEDAHGQPPHRLPSQSHQYNASQPQHAHNQHQHHQQQQHQHGRADAHRGVNLPPPPRPASPSSVEKAASMLRSLTFAAGASPGSDPRGVRGEQYDGVAAMLRRELAGDSMQRLTQSVPQLASQLQLALTASCAVLLGVERADVGFEWATSELDEIKRRLPASAALFPGAYYREIFESDVTALTSALENNRRELKRRKEMSDSVLSVIAREGAAVADLEGVSRAAMEMGLKGEAAAAARATVIVAQVTELRKKLSAAEDEADSAKRASKEATANVKRLTKELESARREKSAVDDELHACKLKLTMEGEARRRIEAASVKTIEQLKVQEEARWVAERAASASETRATEAAAAAVTAREEATEAAAEAERKVAKAAEEVAAAADRYVESERRSVALSGRVSALESVQAQLEQQLALERAACTEEHAARVAAEKSLAEESNAVRGATREAEEAVKSNAAATAELEKARAALKAVEEKLRVANETGLQRHFDAASADDAMAAMRQLRAEDAEKIMALNHEKLQSSETIKHLEEKIAEAGRELERRQAEWTALRYELHASLTESNRKCEALQAEATKSLLMLEHERSLGARSSDEGGKLQAALSEEQRGRQAATQKLAVETALRERAEAAVAETKATLNEKGREVHVLSQKVQRLEAELAAAKTEAREIKEVADFKAAAARERESLLRSQHATQQAAAQTSSKENLGVDASRARPALNRSTQGDGASAPKLNAQPSGAYSQPAVANAGHGGGPRAAPWEEHSGVRRVPSGGGGLTDNENFPEDELSRSDLWDFSSGLVKRGARPPPQVPPQLMLPRINSPYHTGAA